MHGVQYLSVDPVHSPVKYWPLGQTLKHDWHTRSVVAVQSCIINSTPSEHCLHVEHWMSEVRLHSAVRN